MADSRKRKATVEQLELRAAAALNVLDEELRRKAVRASLDHWIAWMRSHSDAMYYSCQEIVDEIKAHPEGEIALQLGESGCKRVCQISQAVSHFDSEVCSLTLDPLDPIPDPVAVATECRER